jgi:hypothetical protein
VIRESEIDRHIHPQRYQPFLETENGFDNYPLTESVQIPFRKALLRPTKVTHAQDSSSQSNRREMIYRSQRHCCPFEAMNPCRTWHRNSIQHAAFYLLILFSSNGAMTWLEMLTLFDGMRSKHREVNKGSHFWTSRSH